jgi:uncharacterized protein (DUF2147 family)
MKITHVALAVAWSLVATSAEASPLTTLPEGLADGPISPADAILGAWASPEREIVIDVTKAAHGYVGVVVRAKSSALVGQRLLRGVTYDAAYGTWKGEVFAPKKGEYLPATFAVRADGSLAMTAGTGPFSKTVLWTRA